MPYFMKCIFGKSSANIKPEIYAAKKEGGSFKLNRREFLNSAGAVGAVSLLDVSDLRAEKRLASDSSKNFKVHLGSIKSICFNLSN
jgi:hypothetical protein